MPDMHILKVKYTEVNISYFTYNSFVCLTACLPAIRSSSTMARAPVFSHNKRNCVRFMKLLYQRKFIHSAMMLPFILY